MPIIDACISQNIDLRPADHGIYSENELKASNICMDGLYAFLLSHEYFHYVQKHLDIPIKDNKDIILENSRRLKKIWESKYSNNYHWPDEGAILEKRKSQLYELDADMLAFEALTIANIVNNTCQIPGIDKRDYIQLYMTGVWIGLCITLYRDRVIYLLTNGKDWDKNSPFFNRDYEIHDILSRDDYPCAYNRAKYMFQAIEKSKTIQQLAFSGNLTEIATESFSSVASFFNYCWDIIDLRGFSEPIQLSPRMNYLLSKRAKRNI